MSDERTPDAYLLGHPIYGMFDGNELEKSLNALRPHFLFYSALQALIKDPTVPPTPEPLPEPEPADPKPFDPDNPKNRDKE